jgi:hypothetical protein
LVQYQPASLLAISLACGPNRVEKLLPSTWIQTVRDAADETYPFGVPVSALNWSRVLMPSDASAVCTAVYFAGSAPYFVHSVPLSLSVASSF